MEALGMSCCGLFELDDLGSLRYQFTSESGGDCYNAPPSDWRVNSGEKLFPYIVRRIQTEIKKANRPHGRGFLATTLRNMRLEAQALQKLRFRRVRTFRNGNTGNQITLWFKYQR